MNGKFQIVRPEEIALAAYLAWERDGRPQGRDLHYWLEAEARLLRSRMAPRWASEKTVLVVDDDASICRFFLLALRQEGYHVLATTSPEEALRLALDHRPVDLLVTDYQMPSMSGAELARRLHALRPGLPVLLVSGAPAELLAGEHLPPSVLLRAKPISSGELAVAVAGLLRPQAA